MGWMCFLLLKEAMLMKSTSVYSRKFVEMIRNKKVRGPRRDF